MNLIACSIPSMAVPFLKHFITILLLCILFPANGMARPVGSRLTPTVKAVQKASPAVVNIFIEESSAVPVNPFRGLRNNFFDSFFQDLIPRYSSKRQSLGSGVLIDPKGYIITNAHVIDKATAIKITLSDNRQLKGRLVGADVKSDLAILKIDSNQPLPYLRMGRSDDLMIGETILAIGNPFGLQHTVTKGIVSALHRTIRASKKTVYHDFIQVDASINPGNSGGPLLNINGSLIGINAAIYSKAEGIGFAIPIDHARRIVNELIEFGKVRRGWLGVSVQDLTENLADYFNLPDTRGVLVGKVFQGGPASRSGIRPGEIILSVDAHEVKDKADYQHVIGSYTVEDTVYIKVRKPNGIREVRLKISVLSPETASDFARHWLGIRVSGISREDIRVFKLGTAKGVLVQQVDPDGVCGQIGIRRGDIILQVNQAKIHTLEEFNQNIIEAGTSSTMLLLVQRGRYGYYVSLEP